VQVKGKIARKRQIQLRLERKRLACMLVAQVLSKKHLFSASLMEAEVKNQGAPIACWQQGYSGYLEYLATCENFNTFQFFLNPIGD
jgi:hypothetical protein